MSGKECDPESSYGNTKECGLDLAIPYFVSFIFFCSFLVCKRNLKVKLQNNHLVLFIDVRVSRMLTIYSFVDFFGHPTNNTH